MPNDLPDWSSMVTQRVALIDTSGFNALQTKGFYTVADTTDRSFTFTIPAGCQSIRFDSFTGLSGSAWTNAHITGDVSGKTYVGFDGQSFPSTGFEENVTFRPLPCDSVLTFRFTPTAPVAVNFIVSSAQFPEDIVVELGGTLGVLDTQPFIVSESNSVGPARWQGPSKTAVVNGSNVNAGASATIIAGVAGQKIYGHGFAFSANTAGGGSNSWLMDDTSGNRSGANSNTSQQDTNPFQQGDKKGRVIAVSGAGLRLTNQNGGALALYGWQDHTQT